MIRANVQSNKKHSLIFTVLLCMLFAALSVLAVFITAPGSAAALPGPWTGGVAGGFAGGTGDQGSPYEISNGEELKLLADLVNSGDTDYNAANKYYKLTADIVLNDLSLVSVWSKGLSPKNSWTPIGWYDEDLETEFCANFDGGGYSIKGIYINTTANDNGLFGVIFGGSVSNVGIEQSVIIGGGVTGGIAGYIEDGQLTGCYNSGAVIGGGIYTGGITGLAYASDITNCHNSGAVIGNNYTGGVAGTVDSADIDSCYNSGDISGGFFTAGIAGAFYDTDIANCYNTGRINGGTYTGGIAGAFNNSDMENCYNTEAVVGEGSVGGIAGYSDDVSIINCYNLGAVSAINFNDGYAGGIVGYLAYDSLVSNCYNAGRINSREDYFGGIAGAITNSSDVIYSYYLEGSAPKGCPIVDAYSTNGTAVFDTDGMFENFTYVYGDNEPNLLEALNAYSANEGHELWAGKPGYPYPRLSGSFIWGGTSDIAAGFAGGTGTASDPYLISNGAELAFLAQQINAGNAAYNASTKYYKLTADIYLNKLKDLENWDTIAPDNSWIPIGKFDLYEDTEFCANFDGGGFSVKGIYINNAADEQGLFGNIYGGNVRNLGVEQSYIKGEDYIGGIAGYAGYFGISSCYNTSAVAGNSNIGGIVGYTADSDIYYCYNTGVVKGSSFTGGIVGNGNGSIYNCYNKGKIDCVDIAGGIAGYIGGSIINSYNTGAVNSDDFIGGIAGIVNSGSVTYCYYLSTSAVIGIGSGIDTTASFNASGAFIAGTAYDNHTDLLSALNAYAADNSLSGFTGTSADPYPTLVYGGFSAGGVWGGADDIAAVFAGGSGTADDPYLISNGSQLALLAQLTNAGVIDPNGNIQFSATSKYYKLTADIYLNNTANWQNFGISAPANSWVPIGTSTNPFSANFDGGGFSVKGIYISGNNSQQGLFGYILNGNIYNLGIEQSYIKGNNYVGGVAGYVYGGSIINCYNSGAVEGEFHAGGIAGYIDGYVSGCYNTGAVSSPGSGTAYTGGIAGSLLGSISECYNTGAVSSTGTLNIYTGGIAGYIYSEGSITDCYNIGEISGDGSGNIYTGGIAGYSNISVITNCYNAGIVISFKDNTGGIAGYSMDGEITDCYNTGSINGSGINTGGIAGYSDGLDIINCYNTGAINGNNYVGGIAGYVEGGEITDCYNTGAIDGTNYIGGIAGYVEDGEITDCYNTGAVKGYNYVGGIAGQLSSKNIINCYNTGAINGIDCIGGIAGCIYYANVINCYNTGAVSGNSISYYAYIGGIVGFIFENGRITNCYNAGAVSSIGSAQVFIGGIAGYIDNNGQITNCYNIGAVNADINEYVRVGGIAGYIYTGEISNCYNTGEVTGSGSIISYIGGIVGSLSIMNLSVSHCYYLEGTAAKGIGITDDPETVLGFDADGILAEEITIAGIKTSELLTALNLYTGASITVANEYLFFTAGDSIKYILTQRAQYLVTFDYNYTSSPDPYVQLVAEGGTAIIPDPAPVRQGYSFDGWYTGDGTDGEYGTEFNPAVSGSITVYAKWTLNSFTVTFVNGNKTLQSGSVEYGQLPEYSGETPSKPWTDEYGYFFSGFSPKIVAATGNAVYTAQFYEFRRTYTVTFISEGETLQKTVVTYGEMAVYYGETPYKQSTAEYSYVFSGWNIELKKVTGPINYTAVFTQVRRTYAVSFISGGVTIQSGEVAYGEMPVYSGSTPTMQPTAQFYYTFTGFDPEIVRVTGEATYTAQYTRSIQLYTVTFADGGTVLQSETLAYGLMPAYNGVTPTKQQTVEFSYTFSGFSPAITNVTGNATYTAQFTEVRRSYTVTFMNGGTTLQSGSVLYGSTPVYSGATPVKASTAEFSYTFSGFSPAIVSVTGAATYTAQFTEARRSYTVTFVNGGTTLQSDLVEYGATPVYSGATPVKASTPEFNYTFSGFSPEIVRVTGEATYTAQFSEARRSYTVSFDSKGGNSVAPITALYNDKINAPAAPARANHRFNGWFTSADGGNTLTAEFVFTTNAVTQDITLYAKWTAYVITLGADSKTSIQIPATIFSGYTLGSNLPVPAAVDGFVFGGWNDGTKIVTKLDALVSDVTLTPVWSLALPSVTIAVGEEDNGVQVLTANVTTYSGISYSYQWYKQSGDSFDEISGATGKTYEVIGNANNGVYRCRVTASAGSLTSEPAYANGTAEIAPSLLWLWLTLSGLGVIAIAVILFILLKKKKSKSA